MGEAAKNSYRNALEPLYSGLYKGEKEPEDIHQGKDTNASLWLDKYIKVQSQEDTDSRSGLVKEVSEIALPKAYSQFYERWEQMLTSAGVTPQQRRTAMVKGRMIIGLGDESVLETSITLHHTYGVPYIPGSALKGLTASFARQRLGPKWQKGQEAYNVVFGTSKEAGFITFFDAPLVANSKQPILHRDIITVHHPEYYQGNGATPSDWDSPTPIPFLSATGTYLIALAAPDLDHQQTWINKTFAILRYALEEMGIGAKTSSGYGRMELALTEDDTIGETEVAEEIVPEPASTSLLRKIAAAPQVTYELFAAWEQLPPDDERRIEAAEALVQKWDSGGGKKRMPKEEKRYQILKKFIAENAAK